MTAVKTPWRQSMPDFLQLLDGTLGHKVKLHKEVLGYDLYLVDLSDWKLRFSDRTPIIIVKEADLASLNARELAQSLAEVVRGKLPRRAQPDPRRARTGRRTQATVERDVPVAAGAGRDRRGRPCATRAGRPANCWTGSRHSSTCRSWRPTRRASPSPGPASSAGSSRCAAFFRRRDSNFAIMGIRRIGKTSLMREIERQLKEQAQEAESEETLERIIFMDCSAIASPNNFIQEVVRKLRPQELTRLVVASSTPSSSRTSSSGWRSATAARSSSSSTSSTRC